MQLIKSLPRIAARVLHNTHVGRQNMKEKFVLMATAYGAGAVEEDFEKWCVEVQEQNPRYPITEYIKVVDARLGQRFAEPHADLKDPRIAEVASFAYEETGVLPSVRSVAGLLLAFTVEEITGALKEYLTTLDEKEIKNGMRGFFTEGGAPVVIYTQRKRNGR